MSNEALEQYTRKLFAHHLGDGCRSGPSTIEENSQQQARAEEGMRVWIAELICNRIEKGIAKLSKSREYFSSRVSGNHQ